LRMTELADAVLLSRSGVTRLVDRLEKSGLVLRCPVENDGRGVAAELTDAGLSRLRVASRTHLAGVVRHFAARLEEDDLQALERISRRLAD
jgi:DNA-binding MarR family transcriptional regulator